jgi:hypothetical protein
MNTRYLKIMLIVFALLFVSQGCSFYAGFSAKQSSPQSDNSKTAANVHQEARATDRLEAGKT